LAAELAAGRESIQSLLIEAEEVFPVISGHPDWPAIWNALAEQLTHTREHVLGSPFEVISEVTSDEELLAALLRWAFSLTVAELDRHAHVGVLRLASAGDEARVIFDIVIRDLSAGSGDEPLQAVLLLSWAADDSFATSFASTVARMIDHPDYVVSVLAERLSRRRDVPVRRNRLALPGFYHIRLEGDDGSVFEPPGSCDPASGAMRVEDPMGWTFALRSMIRPLARGGITIGQIRRRCAMFISTWGGLSAFGHAASERLQTQLRRLDMRLPYARPHMVAAIRAVRVVAGELRRAGILNPSDEGPLLHLFGCPPVGLQVPVPEERPAFIFRPSVIQEGGWREEEAAWIAGTDDDLLRPNLGSDILIAEVTRYIRRNIRRQFVLERLRIPSFWPIEGADLDGWMHSLPRAAWFDDMIALSEEPSPIIVRRLELRDGPGIPSRFLVLCPRWVHQLGWRRHADNWLVYVDGKGSPVTRAFWWRDGGPTDVQEDVFWGEGVAVILTSEGRRQIEALVGELPHAVAVRRLVQPEGDEECRERLVRSPDASAPGGAGRPSNSGAAISEAGRSPIL
jgi:hypothetical protein